MLHRVANSCGTIPPGAQGMRHAASAIEVCPWCQRATQAVWVHGHAQCQHCRTNIDPCCGGDEIIPAGFVLCDEPETRR